MAGPKVKGSRAYRTGYNIGSRKSSMFPNLLKKSGRKQLKTEFESRGGIKGLINIKEALGITTQAEKQYNKGLKKGAEEYYAKKKKKKDSSVKLAKKYFRGGLV